MITYLILSSLSFTIFYIFFLVFKKSTNPTLLRRYVWLATVMSIIIPALQFDLPKEYEFLAPTIYVERFAEQNEKNHFVVSGEPSITEILPSETREIREAQTILSIWADWTVFEWLLTIYWIGVLLFASLLFFSFGRLMFYIIHATPIIHDEKNILNHSKIHNPCTFLHWIFWPGPVVESKDKGILLHELAHRRYQHSLDVIWLEGIKVFWWFLPIVYWIKREMVLLHEYQADDFVLKTLEPKPYAKTLLIQISNHSTRLVHSFYAHLEQRIHRLANPNKYRSQFFYILAPLVIVLCCFSFAKHSIHTWESQISPVSDSPFRPTQLSNYLQWQNQLYKLWVEPSADSTFWIGKSYRNAISKEELSQLLTEPFEMYFHHQRIRIQDQDTVIITFENAYENPNQVFQEFRWLYADFTPPPELLSLVQNAWHEDEVTIEINGDTTSLDLRLLVIDEASMPRYYQTQYGSYPIGSRRIIYADRSEAAAAIQQMYFDGQGIDQYQVHGYIIERDSLILIQSPESLNQYSNAEAVYWVWKIQDYWHAGPLFDFRKKTDQPLSFSIPNLRQIIRVDGGMQFLVGIHNYPVIWNTDEVPIQFTWSSLSSKQYAINPGVNLSNSIGRVSMREFKQMLRQGPSIEISKPKYNVFFTLHHISRQGVPQKYFLTYDLNTGEPQFDSHIIQAIESEVVPGDHFRIEDLRFSLMDEAVYAMEFKIKDN